MIALSKLVKNIGYSSLEYEKLICSLCEKYSFLKMFSFGRSVSGKSLWALRIGTARDCVLMNAAIHGNEYITATLLLKWIEQLCDSLLYDEPFCGIDFPKVLVSRSLVFVPLCNPDGCDIAIGGVTAAGKRADFIASVCGGDTSGFKANLNGVDLNHNFAADWEKTKKAEQAAGIFAPFARHFGGDFPESEPETVALCTLCRVLRFSAFYGLHTQGEVIYVGYKKTTELENKMAQLLSLSSGYIVDEPEPISAAGGFKDWFSLEFKKPAFTVECGFGKNPLPMCSAELIYRRIKEMLAIAAIM